MKIILLIVTFTMSFGAVRSSSFSEIFGSEGSSAIENPAARSLSYSLQYLAFSGITGFFIKQLHDTGFLEPLGFTPNYYKKMSPLAYDKSKFLDSIGSNLTLTRETVSKANELLNLKNQFIQNGPNLTLLKNQSEFLIENSIRDDFKRKLLIERYLKNE